MPKIAEIRNTVDAVRNDLTSSIFTAFTSIGQLAGSSANPDDFSLDSAPGSFRSLGEACLVVDALGGKARLRQIDEFIKGQLMQYGSTFSRGGEAAGLDQVDRRFAWFRRLLKSVTEQFDRVFPPHWRVPRKLCLMFLRQTRSHLQVILEQCVSPGGQSSWSGCGPSILDR